MKLVFRTIFFHLMCIICFAFLYYTVSDNFEQYKNYKYTLFDFFVFSTTIQSGVGMSDMYPIHFYGKLFLMMQELVMIMTYVFVMYIFSK
jgi:hypothetical protein